MADRQLVVSADVFGSFALVVLAFRPTAPGSTSTWPAWRAAATSPGRLGSMPSTVMAGIVLLGAGAVGFVSAPTATMRTDPPLGVALGGAGA